MKKRVSIYIDDLIWEGLKDRAWRARKSASRYLEDLITREVPAPVIVTETNEEVQFEAQRLFEAGEIRDSDVGVIEEAYPVKKDPAQRIRDKISSSDEEMLRRGQVSRETPDAILDSAKERWALEDERRSVSSDGFKPEKKPSAADNIRDKISSEDEELLRKAQAQAKLDADRAKRDIKKEKISKVRTEITSLTGHSGPLPKGGAK